MNAPKGKYISRGEIEDFAKEHNNLLSAKTNENLDQLFEKIYQKVEMSRKSNRERKKKKLKIKRKKPKNETKKKKKEKQLVENVFFIDFDIVQL